MTFEPERAAQGCENTATSCGLGFSVCNIILHCNGNSPGQTRAADTDSVTQRGRGRTHHTRLRGAVRAPPPAFRARCGLTFVVSRSSPRCPAPGIERGLLGPRTLARYMYDRLYSLHSITDTREARARYSRHKDKLGSTHKYYLVHGERQRGLHTTHHCSFRAAAMKQPVPT